MMGTYGLVVMCSYKRRSERGEIEDATASNRYDIDYTERAITAHTAFKREVCEGHSCIKTEREDLKVIGLTVYADSRYVARWEEWVGFQRTNGSYMRARETMNHSMSCIRCGESDDILYL